MKSILSKTIVLFSTYYILVLLTACCKCPKAIFYHYNVQGLYTTNLNYEIYADTSYRISNIDTSHYSQFQYGFSLNFAVELFVHAETDDCFSLTSKAYACKCSENTAIPTDTISNIKIVTRNDFDASHSSGSDVTNLFVQLEQSYNPTQVIKKPLTTISLDEINERNTYYWMPIYLNSAPETPRDVQFDIETTLSNGKVLNATTQKVFLN